MSLIEWPPPYKIKKHVRAKQVKLRLSHQHGLEITVPKRFNVRELPFILETHKDWILKQFARIDFKKTETLPSSITFPAMNRTWNIYYESSQSKLELIERPSQELILVGAITDSKCRKLLAHWVKQQATSYLIPTLMSLSEKMGLTFKKVTIRNQATLWGSCTTQKHISLNYKLIFLPQVLIEYVLIHELCHLVHFNHSKKFWALVAKYDPNWQQHKKELRQRCHSER